MAQTMLQDHLQKKIQKKDNIKSSFFNFEIDRQNAKILSFSISLDDIEKSLYK